MRAYPQIFECLTIPWTGRNRGEAKFFDLFTVCVTFFI